MTLHFEDFASYKRYQAYKHIHGLDKGDTESKIYIAGVLHHVEHKKQRKR